MFTKILAFLLIASVSYTGLVFFAPEVADRYGSPSLNATIRSLKTASDTMPGQTPTTLLDSLRSRLSTVTAQMTGSIASGSEFLDESRRTYDTTKQVIETKIEQGKTVVESVKQAQSDIEQARQSIETTKAKLQDFASFSGVQR